MGYLPYAAVFSDPPDPNTETTWVIRVVEEPGCTAEFVHTSDGESFARYDLTIVATEDEAREEAFRLIDAARKVREESVEKGRCQWDGSDNTGPCSETATRHVSWSFESGYKKQDHFCAAHAAELCGRKGDAQNWPTSRCGVGCWIVTGKV